MALALIGELGTGKTTFTKGLAVGLGVREETRVTSPTFVLKQEYRGPVSIQHYDAYRLSGPAEFLALGFEEDLACGAVVVVEWADRVAHALPEETLWLEFEHDACDVPGTSSGDGGRRRIAFRGPRFWDALVDRVLEQAATARESGR